MNTPSKIASAVLIALMASSSIGFVSTAFAEAGMAPTYATQKELLKMSEEAATAVKDAHAARLAIFNVDPAMAKIQLEKAVDSLTKAEATLSDKLIPDTTIADGKPMYLPFDTNMALAETYTVTPEVRVVLDKATGLFKTGTSKEAIDVLREAGVEVKISAAMLPWESSMMHLKEAGKLIGESKYYEANVALKSFEDGVVVRTFDIEGIPAQGPAK